MGLLRGMARTAVVAGTATAVSNRVSRRQAERWQQQDYAQQAEYAQQQAAYAPPPPPAPAGTGGSDVTAELERLAALRNQGVLSDEEFAAAKAKLLGL
jgi:multidrug resistance efflux pump